MAREDNLVVRVGLCRGGQGCGQGACDLLVGAGEARVQQAAADKIARLLEENKAERIVSVRVSCKTTWFLFFVWRTQRLCTYLVIQLRIEWDPRNDSTIILFLGSVDRKPCISVTLPL